MTIAPVTQLTHYVDESLIARLFARFRGRYGNLWTSRATCDEDWESIMEDWLLELSNFSMEQVRAAVNKTLSEFTTYPPTLGQLVELCMKESGVPSQQEIIGLMVARDFKHPMVKMMFDKISSWELSNGKKEDIERKVKDYYSDVRSSFYLNQQQTWQKLEAYNAKPKELPPPDKIPTNAERIGFKERMSEYYIKTEEAKIKSKGTPYRQFDEAKIKKGSREFDQAVYAAWRDYLMSIPEEQTMILPIKYLYERNKFLNMRDQPEFLKEVGHIPPNQRTQSEPSRSGNGKPNKVYKNWSND